MEQSPAYQQLLERIAWSQSHGYGIFEIDQTDIDLGRLFAYAFRTQTVGAFRAARMLLEGHPAPSAPLRRAIECLRGLEELSLLPVPTDFRVVVGTMAAYDRGLRQALAAFDEALTAKTGQLATGGRRPTGRRQSADPGGTSDRALATIRERFVANINRVTASNGIWMASDQTLPEQGTFKVPGIAVVIVPLVYGDFHSWNNALVPAGPPGQTTHRHRQGVEIHLGYSPLDGRTLLGQYATRIREGYAMPIPPLVDHGFDNYEQHEHMVPFIFGSLRLGGWGIFADVEPRPRSEASYADAPLEAPSMNHSVYLERAIQRAAGWRRSRRLVLIPAERTATAATGGLVLAIRRIDATGASLSGAHYRILSLRRGRARLKLGPVEAELQPHDHVGLPAGMAARLTPLGEEPLVLLEATIEPS